jgi:hypothetical protein
MSAGASAAFALTAAPLTSMPHPRGAITIQGRQRVQAILVGVKRHETRPKTIAPGHYWLHVGGAGEALSDELAAVVSKSSVLPAEDTMSRSCVVGVVEIDASPLSAKVVPKLAFDDIDRSNTKNLVHFISRVWRFRTEDAILNVSGNVVFNWKLSDESDLAARHALKRAAVIANELPWVMPSTATLDDSVSSDEDEPLSEHSRPTSLGWPPLTSMPPAGIELAGVAANGELAIDIFEPFESGRPAAKAPYRIRCFLQRGGSLVEIDDEEGITTIDFRLLLFHVWSWTYG